MDLMRESPRGKGHGLVFVEELLDCFLVVGVMTDLHPIKCDFNT